MQCWNGNCSQTKCNRIHTRPPPPKFNIGQNNISNNSNYHNKKYHNNNKIYRDYNTRRSMQKQTQYQRERKTDQKECFVPSNAEIKSRFEDEIYYDSFSNIEEVEASKATEEDDDVHELMFNKTFEEPESTIMITGIENTGNSCYLNAVIQSISNSKILGKEMEHIIKKDKTAQLTKEVCNIRNTLKSGKHVAITPLMVYAFIFFTMLMHLWGG